MPPGCAASVGLFDVLEHIEDEAVALNLIHSLLEPSGRLFLTVPAYQFLYSSEDREAGHFRRYTIPRLHRVLANSNFRIEFSSYIFTPLPPLVFLSRTITDTAWQASSGKLRDCSLAARAAWPCGLDDGSHARPRTAPPARR